MSTAELEVTSGRAPGAHRPAQDRHDVVQSAFHISRRDETGGACGYHRARPAPYQAAIRPVTGQSGCWGRAASPVRARGTDSPRSRRRPGAATVVVSSEAFPAQASPEAASPGGRQARAARPVHIVVTLRPLRASCRRSGSSTCRTASRCRTSSGWPHPGRSAGHADARFLATPPARRADRPVGGRRGCWQRPGRGRGRIHPARLLRAFEAMLGLPPEFLVAGRDTANRSLTQAEAEVVRRLNGNVFRDQHWPAHSYPRFVRNGAVHRMKVGREPGPDEPRIQTPAWALERAAELGAEMAANIRSTGVQVAGDPGRPQPSAAGGGRHQRGWSGDPGRGRRAGDRRRAARRRRGWQQYGREPGRRWGPHPAAGTARTEPGTADAAVGPPVPAVGPDPARQRAPPGESAELAQPAWPWPASRCGPVSRSLRGARACARPPVPGAITIALPADDAETGRAAGRTD